MFKHLVRIYYRGLFTHSCSKVLFKGTPQSLATQMSGRQSSSGPLTLKTASESLVWIDMEMTGLNVDKDQILEIACLITDPDLSTIIEGPDMIIHQPDIVLKSMNAWCIQNHAKSGLTEACRNSKVSLQEAEQQVLDFLESHVPPGKCPLAGNSVYMDRIFLQRFMPRIDSYLHYRIVDVSTVKELCKRWSFATYKRAPAKKLSHRALSDIRESVKELEYYKSNFFNLC